MDTRERIAPVIKKVYGDNAMSEALITELIDKLPTLNEDREAKVRLICWDFFAGGDTAEVVAGRIEQALKRDYA